MNEKNTQALLKRYPEIFRQHKLPMTQTAMCWLFECGDGWYNIIDTLCRLIKHHGAPTEAIQVKEKYGGLRFYVSECDDYVDGLITFAEAMSYLVCEQCGSTDGVTQTRKGWISTLCRKCLLECDMAQYGNGEEA